MDPVNVAAFTEDEPSSAMISIRPLSRALFLTALIGGATLVHAAPTPRMTTPAVAALSACLADNTTGKDRKDLARWVFVGMGAHPDIKRLASASDADLTDIDRTMGQLMTRLMADACLKQTREVTREGGNGIETAFGQLGELAMQELTNNPAVGQRMAGFLKHVDLMRLGAALAPAATTTVAPAPLPGAASAPR